MTIPKFIPELVFKSRSIRATYSQISIMKTAIISLLFLWILPIRCHNEEKLNLNRELKTFKHCTVNIVINNVNSQVSTKNYGFF